MSYSHTWTYENHPILVENDLVMTQSKNAILISTLNYQLFSWPICEYYTKIMVLYRMHDLHTFKSGFKRIVKPNKLTLVLWPNMGITIFPKMFMHISWPICGYFTQFKQCALNAHRWVLQIFPHILGILQDIMEILLKNIKI